jgi:uncharacterized protein (DUF111 family)
MVILQCNIDDMTAEGIAHMLETFISSHGARDAWVNHTANNSLRTHMKLGLCNFWLLITL